MKFNIIFENSQFLVINKPSGLVVNKSQTVKEETLQDQLSKYFGLGRNDLGLGGRAGIVHRLDRETSGLLLVAKTQKSFDFLQNQFKRRQVKKEYIALVHERVVDNRGSISSFIGRVGKFGKFGVVDIREVSGRETETEYKIYRNYKFIEGQFAQILRGQNFSKVRTKYLKQRALFYSLLSVFPKTGRTHQIRVVLKSIGHPIVSDVIYTPSKLLKFDLSWCPRLFLHAAKLSFKDPVVKKSVSFDSALPKDLEGALSLLTINH